jgi:threonine/homoserine/homoserine lactone efflux protein
MSLPAFLAEAVLISLSGVMAPGPMTATVVGRGSESPHAGALVAIGHGIAEFPLMVAVFYGVGKLFDLPYVKAGIAFFGGLFLLVMGVGMFRSMEQGEVGSRAQGRTPVVAGIMLSVGNPYFLVWWATVGAALILRSVQFGLWGFVAFGLLHWSCDFVWSYFLSALSFKGGQFFGRWFQKAVFLTCGALLLFFGLRLMVDGIGELIGA